MFVLYMYCIVGFLVFLYFLRKIKMVPQKGLLKWFQKINSNFPEMEMIRRIGWADLIISINKKISIKGRNLLVSDSSQIPSDIRRSDVSIRLLLWLLSSHRTVFSKMTAPAVIRTSICAVQMTTNPQKLKKFFLVIWTAHFHRLSECGCGCSAGADHNNTKMVCAVTA